MLGVVGSNLKMVKIEPTTPNKSQHGGQMHATCCAQQCCDMLRWHFAIVWPGLYVPHGTKKIGKQVTQQDCVLPVMYMIETSSYLLWLSSAIFEKCSEMFENVQKRSSGLRNNFGKSSEIIGK